MENKENQSVNALYRALISKCVSERDEAIAVLETLYNRPVGIGEHTNLLEEVNTWTEKLANAIDKLQVSTTIFGQDPNEQGDIEPKIPQESVTASSVGM